MFNWDKYIIVVYKCESLFDPLVIELLIIGFSTIIKIFFGAYFVEIG